MGEPGKMGGNFRHMRADAFRPGGGQLFRMAVADMGCPGEADDPHACRPGRCDAGGAVLNHHGAGRRDGQDTRRVKVQVRGGLRAGNVGRAEQTILGEMFVQTGNGEGLADPVGRGIGTDTAQMGHLPQQGVDAVERLQLASQTSPRRDPDLVQDVPRQILAGFGGDVFYLRN